MANLLLVLITLGGNTLAQPYGRFPGFPASYRLYPRSSPVVCCVDTFSILLRLLIISIRLKSVKRSFRLLISDSFEKEEAKSMVDSILLRYLLFVLGPLPQVIGLAAFKGTPWTKVYGFMFLVSFLTMEVLAWFA